MFIYRQNGLIYESHCINYCGDIIYENIKPVPNRILLDGGYVTFSNKQPVYHFYLTDHQGNVRVVASADGTVEETNHYYPFGALFGESAGSSRQRYKYNGKELERLLALDWYDYGARWYDPVLARWHTVDPLAEKYPDISPYVYCHDNPVNKIDPNGMDDYRMNAYGFISFSKKTDDNFDRLFAVNNSNIKIKDKSFLKSFMKQRNNSDGDFSLTSNSDLAASFFKFVAENTNVEWGMDGYKTKGKISYLIRTSHKEDQVNMFYGILNKLDMFYSIHSHPGKSQSMPSGFEEMNNGSKYIRYTSGNDYTTITNIFNTFKIANKKYPESYPRIYLYHPKSKIRRQYTPLNPNKQVKRIINFIDLLSK